MENSHNSEENQPIQVQHTDKNMQKQLESFEISSTNLANDFIGFEDQQEYIKISEKLQNLKRFVENLNTPSKNKGGDVNTFNKIGKDNDLMVIGTPKDPNPNSKVCNSAKKIRCKSINDLMEKSQDKKQILSGSHSTPTKSPKISQNNDSKVIFVPKDDKILVIKTGKSVTTPSDVANIPRSMPISKGNISTASFPFPFSNQNITYTSSNINPSSMGQKLFSNDTQVPALPISSSIYSNHPLPTIYQYPYIFNGIPSGSRYMQQGINASIGMNSFPVVNPQSVQPQPSFVFNNSKSKFPNIYSNPRNKFSQNHAYSSLPTTATKAAFMCTYCNFTYVNKELFNEHLHAGLCSGLAKKETNDKTSTSDNYHYKDKECDSTPEVYVCHICEKSFDEKDELNSHEMDQHNLLSLHDKTKNMDASHSKRFSCSICHKHFILSKELFLHLKDCHNITNIKDWIPESSFHLQSKNDNNNDSSGSPNMPQIDNLSQSVLKKSDDNDNDCVIVESNINNPIIVSCAPSKTSTVQENCPGYFADNSDKPKASTPASTISISTYAISSSGYAITKNRSSQQISKSSSAVTTSSTPSATVSHSRILTTTNTSECSTHERRQSNVTNKATSNLATSESNTGCSITCPGCSFTFTGDNLFAQHLKAGLCSKFLTDTISKKFPGYTVCNIKKKKLKQLVEDQNGLPKKSNEKYHKLYMCELCTSKFTTKENLLTHRKSAHRATNWHPVPTMLAEKQIQGQQDCEVTNGNLINKKNHPSTQASSSPSEVLTASQSETLQNVNSIITKQLSIVKEITGFDDNQNRALATVESSKDDHLNCVSDAISSANSPDDILKNSENCKSYELELEVKRMELSAWKSWKEACDLQAEFWRNKLASLEENKSIGKSSEMKHVNDKSNSVELSDVNIKQKVNPH